MSKLAYTDYIIRVWPDGDVGISSWPKLIYAQINGMSSLQCNAKDGTEEHKAVKSACVDVANAMRELNDVLMALEDER